MEPLLSNKSVLKHTLLTSTRLLLEFPVPFIDFHCVLLTSVLQSKHTEEIKRGMMEKEKVLTKQKSTTEADK